MNKAQELISKLNEALLTTKEFESGIKNLPDSGSAPFKDFKFKLPALAKKGKELKLLQNFIQDSSGNQGDLKVDAVYSSENIEDKDKGKFWDSELEIKNGFVVGGYADKNNSGGYSEVLYDKDGDFKKVVKAGFKDSEIEPDFARLMNVISVDASTELYDLLKSTFGSPKR